MTPFLNPKQAVRLSDTPSWSMKEVVSYYCEFCQVVIIPVPLKDKT